MLSTMHTSITTSRIIHRVLSVMATMLNASVEPMPVMVTTQMITPMAAQAMVTGSSRAPRHSRPARFFRRHAHRTVGGEPAGDDDGNDAEEAGIDRRFAQQQRADDDDEREQQQPARLQHRAHLRDVLLVDAFQALFLASRSIAMISAA